ncbi:hypothetical protein O181_054001 [Austropuccinia psidii MF-1]|uniref:Uncharacterized protein n=1 Tax=Austropuccinia psidii MF-1 TaxID=1389203 RepID=A0A9Q3HQP6_9BASI|nr:hypothetical protein [Austropuccinia psidii MF-1]
MLEKGWNPRLPAEKLRKDLIEINPTASRFKIMLDKVKHHAKQSMNDAFDYEKQKWDKSHKVPDFKVGDLVLVSTLNFKNIKGPKKPNNSFVGPFAIVALHGTNEVQVESSGELENKHPTFPVSLIKPYKPAVKELFPLRSPTPLTVPTVEQNEGKKIKVIKERRLREKIKENILSDIKIQYMKMNGWQNQKYLTQINSHEDLDMREGHKPEYVYKCALNCLI